MPASWGVRRAVRLVCRAWACVLCCLAVTLGAARFLALWLLPMGVASPSPGETLAVSTLGVEVVGGHTQGCLRSRASLRDVWRSLPFRLSQPAA